MLSKDLFNTQEQDLVVCIEPYLNLGVDVAMFMTHYQLAEVTGVSSDLWRRFLVHPKIAEYLYEELRLYRDNKLAKLLKDVDSNASSTGYSQSINALNKLYAQDVSVDSSKVFIYSYVPLNKNELESGNIEQLPNDIFWEGN